MTVAYLRPDMPLIEEPDRLVRLREWFGEQTYVYLEMSEKTFNYLLVRLGINPNNRITTFDEPQILYGYRIILQDIQDFYVKVYNIYELT